MARDQEKLKKLQHEWYLSNKTKIRERKKISKRKLKEDVKALKESTPCMDCGVKYPYYVMDFDHRENVIKLRKYF